MAEILGYTCFMSSTTVLDNEYTWPMIEFVKHGYAYKQAPSSLGLWHAHATHNLDFSFGEKHTRTPFEQACT